MYLVLNRMIIVKEGNKRQYDKCLHVAGRKRRFSYNRVWRRRATAIDMRKGVGFLIVLSIIQDRFPWIYNIGKELLEILASENDIDVKRKSIRDFQRLMEFSFENPMIREVYMRKKDEYITMREIEYILMELVNSLEQDINVYTIR